MMHRSGFVHHAPDSLYRIGTDCADTFALHDDDPTLTVQTYLALIFTFHEAADIDAAPYGFSVEPANPNVATRNNGPAGSALPTMHSAGPAEQAGPATGHNGTAADYGYAAQRAVATVVLPMVQSPTADDPIPKDSFLAEQALDPDCDALAQTVFERTQTSSTSNNFSCSSTLASMAH